MTVFILRRLATSIPLLLGISILTFAMIHAAPGDPSTFMIDPSISAADKERMRVALGLDQPVHVQYFAWLNQLVQGDLGTSLIRNRPVAELIMNRLPNTLLLMGSALLLATLLAIPFGIISAIRKNTKLDYAITFASFLGVATPNFWLAILLVMFLSVQLGWFPTGGMSTLGSSFHLLDRLHHLILPAFVLATADMAAIARYTRSSMLEVIGQDYIRTARAKGFTLKKTMIKHGLRNAMIPIVTIFGLTLPAFIGGSVIVEQIFSWPGLGKLFIDSVFQRDYPVIMALTMLSAIFVVAGNFLADVMYTLLDPRIHY